MRSSLRIPALLLGLAILAGCATTRPATDLPAIDSWESRTAVLGSVREWEFRGRVAVKAGDEGFNGKFDWIQDGDVFSATVGGPLGVGTVRITGNGRSMVLTDKNGERTELENAELELRWRYGWAIPVASLRYWALGIPDPALPAITDVDDAGRLTHLEQSGWSVDISRYREGGGQQMPRILTATNPETRVRMVIDRWSFFDN
jgi:outer membrane lipoprotein LolB